MQDLPQSYRHAPSMGVEPDRRSPSTAWPSWAWLMPLLALLGACGGSEAPVDTAAAGRFERLELRLENPGVEAPQTKTVARFHFAQAVDPEASPNKSKGEAPSPEHSWEVPEGCEVRRINGEPALVLPDQGMFPLVLTTEVDPKRVSRVLIRGVFSKGSVVELQLLRDGKVVGKPSSVSPLPAKDVQSVSLDLLRFRRVGKAYDTIRFKIGGKRPPAKLFTVDLLERPLSAWLPTTFSGPDLIPVENEAMRGLGLVDGQPLLASFKVEQPGERLQFAVVEPPELRSGKASRDVVVETLAGQELFRTTLAPPAQLTPEQAAKGQRSPNPSWQHVDLDLDAFVGQELDLRFRVETKTKAKGYDIVALAQPTLVRKGSESRLVLLITSDTHRGDHLGSLWAGEGLKTPALDALAARGVQFTDAWSTTNITQPSHTSLLTGLSPRDTRIVTNSGHLRPDAVTLAEVFHDAGWATYGSVSVRHLGARGASLGQGFDRMIDPPGKPWPASDPVGHLKDWISSADGRPVFAWLHVFDAHDPYSPPGEYDRAYYPKDKDPRDPSLPDPVYVQGSVPFDWLDVRDPEFAPAQYRAEISYLDSQLATLFALPRVAAGHVAFTSDHGEILNAMGTWINHGLSVPDTLHVPLILAGPDVPQAKVAAPVEHVNVARTLLDLGGLGRVDFPGSNLLESLGEGADDSKLRFAMGSNGQHAAVTRGPWHLVLSLRAHKGFLRTSRLSHQVELYNRVADPRLEQDQVDAEPELAAELRGELVRWLGEALPGGLSVMGTATPESLAELAALGYAQAEEIDSDAAWFEADCGCDQCARWN